MQNLSFLFPAVVVTIASTHFANLQKDGQAELAWMDD